MSNVNNQAMILSRCMMTDIGNCGAGIIRDLFPGEMGGAFPKGKAERSLGKEPPLRPSGALMLHQTGSCSETRAARSRLPDGSP